VKGSKLSKLIFGGVGFEWVQTRVAGPLHQPFHYFRVYISFSNNYCVLSSQELSGIQHYEKQQNHTSHREHLCRSLTGNDAQFYTPINPYWYIKVWGGRLFHSFITLYDVIFW
jgi:hypothetical protein